MPDRNDNALVPVQVAERTPMTGLVNLAMTPTGGELATATDKVLVVLARSGVGAKKYAVPKGSTMRDLCQTAEADANNQDITIGKSKIDLDYVFTKPELVFMVSKPKNA